MRPFLFQTDSQLQQKLASQSACLLASQTELIERVNMYTLERPGFVAAYIQLVQTEPGLILGVAQLGTKLTERHKRIWKGMLALQRCDISLSHTNTHTHTHSQSVCQFSQLTSELSLCSKWLFVEITNWGGKKKQKKHSNFTKSKANLLHAQ